MIALGVFIATLVACFATGGGIAYAKHRRTIHKPNYAHIATLERELGITLPTDAKPAEIVSSLRIGADRVISLRVPTHNYVQHLYGSSYSPEQARAATVAHAKRPRVLGPNGKPL